MKYGGTNYIYSDNEMMAAANRWECPEAVESTLVIAEKCEDIDLELNSVCHMPSFEVESADDYQEFSRWRAEKKRTTNEIDD